MEESDAEQPGSLWDLCESVTLRSTPNALLRHLLPT